MDSLSIDFGALRARLDNPKKDAQATKHQADAVQTWEELGDDRRYLPQYLAVFKRAGQFIDLKEIKEAAKTKKNPGAYFLTAARRAVGISKKKVISQAVIQPPYSPEHDKEVAEKLSPTPSNPACYD
jgi:hypothetical protein